MINNNNKNNTIFNTNRRLIDSTESKYSNSDLSK